jgi:hypothetical protein
MDLPDFPWAGAEHALSYTDLVLKKSAILDKELKNIRLNDPGETSRPIIEAPWNIVRFDNA